jgi:Flp pilus assembly pilin Flp
VVLAGQPGRRRGPRRLLRGERGAQTVEFALVLPAVLLLLVAVVHAGLLGADLVVAQTLAREAARAAAVTDDTTVAARLRDAAGARPVEVEVDPPAGERRRGDLVTARLRVRSRAFAPFGAEVWLPAWATMQVEDAG